jgi:hypothetical protein
VGISSDISLAVAVGDVWIISITDKEAQGKFYPLRIFFFLRSSRFVIRGARGRFPATAFANKKPPVRAVENTASQIRPFYGRLFM